MVGIPTGVALLLKSFGLDPAQVVGTLDSMGQIMAGIHARLTAIEAAQARIEHILIARHVDGLNAEAANHDNRGNGSGNPETSG